MTTETGFSDEELTAYLDGELDQATAGRIDAALARDAALRQRLDALHVPVETVRAAFDGLLDAAPPMPQLPPAEAPRQRRALTPVLSAVAGLAIGAWVGGFALKGADQPQKDWMAYVAAYQALYVDETLTVVDQPAPVMEAELQRLGAIMERDFAAVRGDPALSFKRGQLLGFEGRELVQLAFLSPGDAPVALCIIRSPDAGTAEIVATRLEDLAAAHWSADGYSYLLIGGDDEALIREAAERFRAAI